MRTLRKPVYLLMSMLALPYSCFNERVLNNQISGDLDCSGSGREITNIEDCLACEGSWNYRGYFDNVHGIPSCNLPASDVGVPCSDSSECEGVCLASFLANDVADEKPFALGVCSEFRRYHGCANFVENGEITEVYCID